MTKTLIYIAAVLLKPLSKLTFQIEAIFTFFKVKSKKEICKHIGVIDKFRLICKCFPNKLYKKMIKKGAPKLIKHLDIVLILK